MEKLSENVLKWIFGIIASLILTLGGWVYDMSGTIAELRSEVNSHERQLQNLWRNYNIAQDKENAALQRVVKLETQIENCCY